MAAGARARVGMLVLVWLNGRRGVYLPARVAHASGTGFVRRVALAGGQEIGWREIYRLDVLGDAPGVELSTLAAEYFDRGEALAAVAGAKNRDLGWNVWHT